MKMLKFTAELELTFNTLGEDSLYLKVYVNASFVTNKDYSSQIGYIVILCDKSGSCHILDYCSRKSRRVARSIMGGEVMSLSAGYDRDSVMKHDLIAVYIKYTPMLMLTDSKQLFDAISKGSSTEERCLLIDIVVAREAYQHGITDHVGLVHSENNVTDGLTKVKFCRALNDVITTGIDKNPVEQWIKRTTTPSVSNGRSVSG